MMPLELRVTGERILIDAREFIPGRYTGIARVLEGLVAALSEAASIEAIFLAAYSAEFTPSRLRTRKRIRITEIPKSYIRAENSLSDLSRSTHLFISPYPKLPLFGVHCRAIHIVHDVLDLTHPLYRRRFKTVFDRYRLKSALHRADITWYDSSWSMAETLKHFGWCGRNPKVRHPGIQDVFRPQKQKEDNDILESLRPERGIRSGSRKWAASQESGNPTGDRSADGTAHRFRRRAPRIAGCTGRSRYRGISAKWIRHVEEKHLPCPYERRLLRSPAVPG